MRCSGITLHLQCQRPNRAPKGQIRNLFIPFAKTQNLPNLTKRLGGARRSRTDDLMLAKHALYQLSYGPQKVMVGPGRLELPTSRLSGVRSNQLSYGPSKGCSPITRRAVLSLRWHYNPMASGQTPKGGCNGWKEKRRRRRSASYIC